MRGASRWNNDGGLRSCLVSLNNLMILDSNQSLGVDDAGWSLYGSRLVRHSAGAICGVMPPGACNLNFFWRVVETAVKDSIDAAQPLFTHLIFLCRFEGSRAIQSFCIRFGAVQQTSLTLWRFPMECHTRSPRYRRSTSSQQLERLWACS